MEPQLIDTLIKNNLTPFEISATTVMPAALVLALFLKPKNIVTLGFDVPQKVNDEDYSNTVSGTKRFRSFLSENQFPIEIIEEYLHSIKSLASERRINIYNISPRTHENVLSKLDSIENFNEIVNKQQYN